MGACPGKNHREGKGLAAGAAWALVAALALTGGCGLDKKSHSRRSGGGGGAEKASVKTLESANSQGKIVDQEPSTPRFMLLDADALQFAYARALGDAFPKEPFSPTQRYALGSYNIVTRNDREKRSDELKSLTQEYLKTLREVLATPCATTVAADVDKLAAGAPGAKLAVAAAGPSAAHVSGLMETFFGYPPVSGLHEGADAYAAAFKAGVDDFLKANPAVAAMGLEGRVKNPAYQETLKRLYTALCIAVGEDPRVYIR